MNNNEMMIVGSSEDTAENDNDSVLMLDDNIDNNQNIFRRHIIDDPRRKLLVKHQLWLESIQHEYPMPYIPYKIGVYIRYYNQTKYDDYLQKHIQQFTDDISLSPKWTLVDFYIDTGAKAPRMENAKEWCRLVNDCFSGKVDLIVTQKLGNVCSDPDEISFLARIFATQKHPVGMYFISEDIFTLASYYRDDMNDRAMIPAGVEPLPDDDLDIQLLSDESIMEQNVNKALIQVGDGHNA